MPTSSANDTDPSEILEFLSSIQETLAILTTKVSAIEQKVEHISASLPKDNDDDNLEPLDYGNDNNNAGETTLAAPIRRDVTQGGTMKASLARIEAKLKDVEQYTSQISMVEFKLDLLAKSLEDIDPMYELVKKTATSLEVKKSMSDVETKVDGVAVLVKGIPVIDSRLLRIEQQMSAGGTFTGSNAKLLGDINNKVIHIVSQNDDAKRRDLTIYHNTIIREINANLFKNSYWHHGPFNVNTGESMPMSFSDSLDKLNGDQLKDYLLNLGAPLDSITTTDIPYMKRLLWGYVIGGSK